MAKGTKKTNDDAAQADAAAQQQANVDATAASNAQIMRAGSTDTVPADATPWTPPTSDQEFVFTGLDDLPAWCDRNWAGYDAGPALALPAGDLYGDGPYVTKTARIGDTVKFLMAKGGKPSRFEVIEGAPTVEDGTGTLKPAQVTNATLEDLLKTGAMQPDELGDDAKAQVAARSPGLGRAIEADAEIAPDNSGEYIKK